MDLFSNKYWYFCDTYLFLEREDIDLGGASKVLKNEIRKNTTMLFTSEKMDIVCKTTSDWKKLIGYYTAINQTAFVEKLNKHYVGVQNLENKVIYFFGIYTT